MNTTIFWAGALLLTSVSLATADDGENLAMSRVRLSTESRGGQGLHSRRYSE